MKLSEIFRIASKEFLKKSFKNTSFTAFSKSEFICCCIGNACRAYADGYYGKLATEGRKIISSRMNPNTNKTNRPIITLADWLHIEGYIPTSDARELRQLKLDKTIQAYRKAWMLHIADELEKEGK